MHERINLSQAPRAVAELGTFLYHREPVCRPFPLRELPPALQRREVLRGAMDLWLVRLVVWSGSASTRPSIGSPVHEWRRFNEVGFADSLDEALEKNAEIRDVSCQLHVELTASGGVAVNEYLLRERDAPPPDDLMTLKVASQHYHITCKGLRDAIHAPVRPLRDYRDPTAASNVPMLVSEADVAKRWPKREVALT